MTRMAKKECKHKWKLVCPNCDAEEGDDVYECTKCWEDKYVSMEEKLKTVKK